MRLGEGAYGMTVRREIELNTGRKASLGAIYATLDRLEEKGLVSSTQGESTRNRRGRAKRFFKAEAPGIRALQESLAALDRLRKGIKELDDPIGAET
jgi:DNA-binding PadR family transcriptional regulator